MITALIAIENHGVRNRSWVAAKTFGISSPAPIAYVIRDAPSRPTFKFPSIEIKAPTTMIAAPTGPMKAFAASADQANVFVLDHQGKILKRLRGRATEQSLEELCVIIEQALADAKKRVASP